MADIGGADTSGVDGKVERTEEEWRALLGEERYRVLRTSGTEAPFSGDLLNNKADGAYVCGRAASPCSTATPNMTAGRAGPASPRRLARRWTSIATIARG